MTDITGLVSPQRRRFAKIESVPVRDFSKRFSRDYQSIFVKDYLEVDKIIILNSQKYNFLFSVYIPIDSVGLILSYSRAVFLLVIPEGQVFLWQIVIDYGLMKSESVVNTFPIWSSIISNFRLNSRNQGPIKVYCPQGMRIHS